MKKVLIIFTILIFTSLGFILQAEATNCDIDGDSCSAADCLDCNSVTLTWDEFDLEDLKDIHPYATALDSVTYTVTLIGVGTGVTSENYLSFSNLQENNNYQWRVRVGYRYKTYGFYFGSGRWYADTTYTDTYLFTTPICVVDNNPPVAAFSCDPSDCIAYYSSDSDSGLVLENESYDPDGLEDISACSWRVLIGPSTKYYIECSPFNILCYFGVPGSILESGEYRIKLKVDDQAGESSVTFGDIVVKKDIEADFLCSMDGKGPWEDCTDFKGTQKEYVYFKDISTVSEEAEYITSRIWELDGDAFSDENEATSSVELFERSNIIELTVEDDQGRIDTASYTLGARLPLPTWKEVAP